MPPPDTVNPVEALEIVTRKIMQGHVSEVDTETAGGHFLAEDVPGLLPGSSFPSDPPDIYRAACDGFALPAGSGLHDELELDGSVAGPGPNGKPAFTEEQTFRVESGSLLPERTWAVLPVKNATLLGTGRIRIEQIPQAGDGILGHSKGVRRIYDQGSRLGPRLQATLLASGITRVNVHSLPRIGVLFLGEELIDLKSEPSEGRVYDLNGYWLMDSIKALGLDVIPLGISDDGPEGIYQHLGRCRTRKVDVLILSGGTGDGVNDRSAESIRELNGKVLLERISLHGCPSLLFGKMAEMDVLGLSGEPLACAAGFDLFARPLLLARSGACESYWNWTYAACSDEMLTPPPPCENKEISWTLQVGKYRKNSSELISPPIVKSWNPETPFTTLAAGSQGWILRPPEPARGAVFFIKYS